MAEYIDREKLLGQVIEVKLENISREIRVVTRTQIEETPTADVKPIVHGKWTDGDCICPICGEDKFKDLDADIWADWKPKYCPNCGAKMDKE